MSESQMCAMPRQAAPKILILERQMIIAADLSLQLLKLGYDVIGINTCPEDAMKTLASNRPDIVLIEMELRGNAEGLRTARIILERFQIPVIFLSASIDRNLLDGILATRPYAFIGVPFEKKDLKRGVETTLLRMAAEGLWSSQVS